MKNKKFLFLLIFVVFSSDSYSKRGKFFGGIKRGAKKKADEAGEVFQEVVREIMEENRRPREVIRETAITHEEERNDEMILEQSQNDMGIEEEQASVRHIQQRLEDLLIFEPNEDEIDQREVLQRGRDHSSEQ